MRVSCDPTFYCANRWLFDSIHPMLSVDRDISTRTRELYYLRMLVHIYHVYE